MQAAVARSAPSAWLRRAPWIAPVGPGDPAHAVVPYVLAPTLAITAAGIVGGHSTALLVVGLGVALIVLVVSLLRLRERPAELLLGLLLWLSVERFAVAAMSPRLDPGSLRLLLIFKEVFFPLVALMYLPRVRERWREAPPVIRVIDVLAVAFGILVLVGVLLSSAPVADRILYARRLALLPMVYLAVRLMPWTTASLLRFTAWLVAVGLALAAFGLVERFLLEDAVWRVAVPAAYYYHLSSIAGLTAGATDFPVGGLPIVFYDFTAGAANRRLVSTFMEATTLASFLALVAVVAASLSRPSWFRPAAVVIALACLLTLSKAGTAMLVGGLGYMAVTAAIPRLRHPVWLVSVAATLVGVLVVVGAALYASGATTGALAHFRGLQEGIAAAVQHPLGLGLGLGGDFSGVQTGGESTFGVLLAQLGVLGLVTWSVWLIGLAVACAALTPPGLDWARLGPAIGIMLIGFYATAALTESAGGLLGNWAYPALAAGLVCATYHGPAVEAGAPELPAWVGEAA